jgi:hypothetical protein
MTRRDTLENWQFQPFSSSQVVRLAFLLHIASPQSEGDDRMEANLDAILAAFDAQHGDEAIRKIDGSIKVAITIRALLGISLGLLRGTGTAARYYLEAPGCVALAWCAS